MDTAELTRLLKEKRRSLGLERGEHPLVQRIIEHPKGQLHAVVPDRADKSQCIGPGGRLVAEVAREIGKDVTFHGADELALRKIRLKASKFRIRDLVKKGELNDKGVFSIFQQLIELEIAFPNQSIHDYRPDNGGGAVAAAYSGGVDSSAALAILRDAKVDTIAYTVSPGPRILAPPDITMIREFCEGIGAASKIVGAPNLLRNVLEKSIEGRIHPCGECHAVIMEKVIEKAEVDGHIVIVTGESLPTGRQALQKHKGIYLVHLPALLNMTKYRMMEILKHHGFSANTEAFGCQFLSKLHSRGWKMAGPSIYRILRELEAGVLNSRQALGLIKRVAKPSMSNEGRNE